MHLGIKNFIGGPTRTLFGDGTYSGNIIQGGAALQPQDYLLDGITPLANCIVVTGAATVAPDATTGAAWFSCENIVIIGASASLTASTNCKGLIGVVKGKYALRSGATSHMTKKGKAGNFGNLTVHDLVSTAYAKKLSNSLKAFVVLGTGAAAQGPTSVDMVARVGNAAGAMQTGGGGEGRGYGSPGGGCGGPCCGGAGAGGDAYTASNTLASGATIPGAYGGPGGNCGASVNYYSGAAGGGAGDPVGAGRSGAAIAEGPGGGLFWVVAYTVSIASGCSVTAAGSTGGGSGTQGGGGGSGGGCIVFVTSTSGYSNQGTVSAPGGLGGSAGSGVSGSAGGVGSVNILEIAA